jgi:predicted ATP-grasp superfamily ATP-dependent carboligase
MNNTLLIVGASARAAAFSALRAGLHPCCVDLFADVDLQRRCPVTRLTERYPYRFQRFLNGDLSGSWMYAGGLENWPRLVERWARLRSLWGNDARALSLVRDPANVARLFRTSAMPVPNLAERNLPETRRWLLKPRRGAGGAGVRFWTPGERIPLNGDHYLQEYIEGQSLALLFLGDGRTARLLGATRQLVGESWLHAAPFHYCGSIGPLDPGIVERPSLEELGRLLASECGLQGLFGVDGILRDGLFYPVEINPRYTASVEVLEYATGLSMLQSYAHVFTHHRLPPITPITPITPIRHIIGKAILFARADLHFPSDGPWMKELDSAKSVQEMPAFADIPSAGERIESGKPILTFFARADSPSSCEDVLRQIAADLDRWLFQR